MARIDVVEPGVSFALDYQPGPSLDQLLLAAGSPLRRACAGRGRCGLCRVQITGGEPLPPANAVERQVLNEEQLTAGERLACQLRPQGDLRLKIRVPLPLHAQGMPLAGAAASDDGADSRALSARRVPLVVDGDQGGRGYRAAVDLGTTHIRAALLRLASAQIAAVGVVRNPQVAAGDDVLSRLAASASDATRRRELAKEAASGVAAALAAAAAELGVPSMPQLQALTLVANGAMLALLREQNASLLLDPSSWQAPPVPFAGDVEHLRGVWGVVSGGSIALVDPVGGFVGSDLLAAVVATRLTEGPTPALLIDLGTNAELALWDGEALWVSATAGGPAFEASGYHAGMPAEAGAIFRVQAASGEPSEYRVLGDAECRGICGSGLVDLFALLRRTGVLAADGRFTGSEHSYHIPLPDGFSMTLVARDVDIFVQAKAAIVAGISLLCGKAQVAPELLARVCIAGEFGRYLRIVSARELGLLPPVPLEAIELWPDAALLGCCDHAAAEAARASFGALRAKARLLNLAFEPLYEELFIANLRL